LLGAFNEPELEEREARRLLGAVENGIKRVKKKRAEREGLPSKVDSEIPVLNRYFGACQDGELKVRGIEARRHDTPPAFAEYQMEILSHGESQLCERGKDQTPRMH